MGQADALYLCFRARTLCNVGPAPTGREGLRKLTPGGGALGPDSSSPASNDVNASSASRDGCCNTNGEDVDSHTVCAVMTATFLEFSKSRGNDLSTPMPQFGFPGLRPGDRWCLCAPRWLEALEAGYAPCVVLRATHEGALDHCSLADLKRFALDLA